MKIKGGDKHQLATAMDPWSKVELLTHHPGCGHGDVETSGMVRRSPLEIEIEKAAEQR